MLNLKPTPFNGTVNNAHVAEQIGHVRRSSDGEP